MPTRRSELPNDTELIARLRAGDAEAYAWLFHARYTSFVDFAQSITGHPKLAEDVVADVMAWLYEHRATLAPRTSLAAYLFTAIRRRALNACRGARRANARYTDLGHAPPATLSAAEPRIDDALIDAEDLRALDRMVATLLGHLGEPARSIVLLRFTQDLAHDEIAEVMGMSADAVRAQFSRAIRTLRHIAGDDPREG